jgi:hypothetical protein
LRRCYVEALANEPQTRGRIRVRAWVNTRGGIERANVAADDTAFPALACCVVAVVRRLQLGATHASRAVGIEYPFSFRIMQMPVGQTTEFVYSAAGPDGFEVVLDAATVQRSIVEPAASTPSRHLTEDKYASPGTPLD